MAKRMRRAWAKRFSMKSGIRPSREAIKEYATRVGFNPELGRQARFMALQHVEQKYTRLFGNFTSGKTFEEKQDSIRRHVCILRQEDLTIVLFYNAKGNQWHFEQTDLVEELQSISIIYKSRDRAMKALCEGRVFWKEIIPLPTPVPATSA